MAITIKHLSDGTIAVKQFDGIDEISWKLALYASGDLQPRYPMPATEVTSLLAMPYENIGPVSKRVVLRYLQRRV